jgi:hypothetical protein
MSTTLDTAKETDVVIFRKWKDGSSIIALFPEIPADNHGRFCESYEHVGQHGGADYHGVISQSKPATTTEAKDLHDELSHRGYNLKIMRRATSRHHLKRLAAARI